MARLEQKHRGISENIIVKVTPVDIPTSVSEWEFGGILWKDSEGKSDPYRYPPDKNRKL